MTKRFLTVAATFAFASALSANAWALTITSPITSLNDPNIVGAMGIAQDSVNTDASVETETEIAQHLLDMDAGTTDPDQCSLTSMTEDCYQTSTTEYTNTLSGGIKSSGDDSLGLPANSFSYSNPEGYDYILAKYDGQNAGYILFYVGGESFTIPEYSYTIWGKNDEQYRISHFTAFDCTDCDEGDVPDGGSTAALLGSALCALGLAGRRFRRQ